MTPEHVHELVDDYLHDLLSREEAEQVRAHCSTCASCRAALDEARRRLAALEAVPRSEPSEELVQETLDGVADYERRRRRRPLRYALAVLGLAAAAALTVGGLQVYYNQLTPTRSDLKVLGQSQLLAGSEASLRILLIRREPGHPGVYVRWANMPVEVTLRDRRGERSVKLATVTTDDLGTAQPRFTVPDWPEGDYELHVSGGVFEKRGLGQLGGDTESVIRPVRLVRSWQVMLSSDKPIYQPGQTIHLRALSLRRPDLKPVAGEAGTFTVSDPKGNVIFKHQAKTSRFGILSADCDLATEVLEGAYTIACRVGDTESRLTVDVRRYVLPRFQVGVRLDKPYYGPGDTVRATVQADYFFGKPVAGGTVVIEAQAPEVGKPLLHRATAKTDDAGKAVFTFPLEKQLFGRPQDSGDARLSLQVQVTDSAGQQQGRAASLLVTARPLRIEVIPENGSVVADASNRIYVMTTYADGTPARTTLRVVGAQESPAAVERTTNALGVAQFDVTMPAEARTWSVEARDDKGLTARREVALVPGQVWRDFLLRTDRAVYRGGEAMTLTVLGGGQEPVFIDLIKDGQTVLTGAVEVKDGKGELTIDLPPELFGTLQLCAYRLNEEGVSVRKARTLYVQAANRLTVKTTFDRAEYRPGEKARLSLELRDKDGKPTPGALSLAAVDEAVFNVLQQRPGMEGVFYTLDEKLLQPVYAIYPWAPDVDASAPNEERDRFEQALFSRTVQTGVAPHSLTASSYEVKAEQTERKRAAALERIKTTWKVIIVAILLLAYVGLWAFVRPLWIMGLLHVVGLAFLCGVASLLVLTVGGLAPESLMEMARGDAAGAMPPMAMARDAGADAGGDGPTLRVRQQFPETLLWRPELITDDSGRAALDIDLADSITTWRLTASAVTADGRLGAAQAGITVFQPFFVDLNLPVSLTRGDEVAVPVVVYNYLDQPQSVELTLADAPWCDRLDEANRRLDLKPREVRSTSFRLRVKTVGLQALQVTAKAGAVADAVKREVEIVSDGRRVEQVANGTLDQPATTTLTVPENAIEGSAKLLVKFYPSSFSQLVEGLDGIFQQPYGCFEQTSSTTYPNVLALDYLKKTGKAAPEVEAKARQYIHLGYQRLVTFEVPGGGFDWFGRPPANRTLTAYGLMEFRDMAKVHDVDRNLIERTRRWLLSQRQRDGSWPSDRGMLNDGLAGAVQRGQADLNTTAYIAWAVFGGGDAPGAEAEATRAYLLKTDPDSLDSPYTVALVANALLALDPEGKDARPFLDRLEKLKKPVEDGKLVFWQPPADARTNFYGAGASASVEATALATLALLQQNSNPATTRGGLAWLVRQKDARGVWPSTQATVLALKALLAGTGKTLGEGERRFEVALGGQTQSVVIPADQAEVMKQLDLSSLLKPGANALSLRETSATAAGYQMVLRYHVPGEGEPVKEEPLSVQLTYDRTELTLSDTLTATATVTNRMRQAAPMVILDLPIPPGFALESDDLAKAVGEGKIAKYQTTPRSAIVYLRSLAPGQTLTLTYRLRPTMPVKVSVTGAQVYEYYDVEKRGSSRPTRLTVTGR